MQVEVGDFCCHNPTGRFFCVTGYSEKGLVAEVSELKTNIPLAVYSSELRPMTDEEKFEWL